ncbi:hypothetical protein [Streptomyces liangshanensis]|uniref:DoxX family membrane protein n=1 Tax=Streptomyces liangshanensis TaxID=2717324 RepID=A0A6G9H2K3_9ACTN|nr:hypothetical protein [Streptomyces liangshanensis]QIQ04758.1 hypothetical protein HA039_22960 [Streptomyces liangshanensis]
MATLTRPPAPGPLGSTRTPHPSSPGLRRLHGAAVVRIGFGLLWAADATFKWLPGFIHGQTIGADLGAAATVHTPVIHQWLDFWNTVGSAHPMLFAVGTAIVESLIALGLIFGAFSNLVFVGSAIFSLGIWSSAEAFGLPWSPGTTDPGTSIGYVFASLALFYAVAGATWSLDSRIRPKLGRLRRLSSRVPEAAEPTGIDA